MVEDDEVVDWSRTFLSDFHQALLQPFVSSRSVVLLVKWQSPTVGRVKMNSDTVLNLEEQLVGIGVCHSKSSGQVLGSSWQSFSAALSPAIVVVGAIHRGLIFASKLGVVLGSIESDATALVDLINCREPSFTDIGLVVKDIHCCLLGFHGCKVSFIPRAANSVAHGPAKLALSSRDISFLIDDVPPWVESLVLADMLR
ncbi:hypothetical protein ACOSQ3_016519 [Xanthoceras sorbifolium]